MAEDRAYIPKLNNSIRWLVRNGLRISMKRPSHFLFFMKMFFSQGRAAKRRKMHEENGVDVPPFIIFSITNQCNLQCKGCYNKAQHRPMADEMDAGRLDHIVREADELGVSFILLAGGEPLVRKDILESSAKCPGVTFPLFTNGMLIDDSMISRFSRQKNIVPVISLEGYEQGTDERRGAGVYRHLEEVLEKLDGAGIFYGVSLTVTKENFQDITSEVFIKSLMDRGCRLFFYVEYVPVKEGTGEWVPDAGQRAEIAVLMKQFRRQFPALFIAFPGDEADFGGCLSAGRGFVHISPDGSLEPCPFAPYSDTSLKEMSLKDALKSDFLRIIRENHGQLSEVMGGCALWEKREWVKSMLIHK